MKGLSSKAKSMGFSSVTGSPAKEKPDQILMSEKSGETDWKRYWRQRRNRTFLAI